MTRKAAPRTPSTPAQEGLPLETLEQVVATLNPETDPGELAAQESGELAPADASRVERILHGKNPNANGDGTTWVLGRGSNPVGVLETQPKGKLDAKTRGWMDLFRRYAEVALESSERRHAVIELSTIVEATKRLNSTLDLAELLNIILQLTTRHTGAERGTVFLVDHERKEIWSLVGLGLEQHEIRLPISKGIAGWVAEHGEAVNLPDAYADPRFESEVDLRLGFKTKSLLCLPILSKADETIGVLQLLNKNSGPFTNADENL